MPRNIPQEILDQLSPEELEGMLDEDLTEEGEPDGSEPDADADPDGGQGEGGDDDDASGEDADAIAAAAAAAEADKAAAAAAAAASAPTAGSEPDAGAGANDDQQTEEADPDDVTPAWLLPIGVKEEIDGLKAQRMELAEKWDNGEITATEHRKLADDLEEQLDALKEKQMAAGIARATAVNKWGQEVVPEFLSKNPEYKRSQFMLKALEEKVKEIQKTSRNPLNPKILARAHADIRREIYGDNAPAPAPKPEQRQAEGKTAKAATPPRPGMPPTLRDVPQADAVEAGGGGEFGYLDRLMDTDSIAFEAALAKLPEDKRDRYLAQG